MADPPTRRERAKVAVTSSSTGRLPHSDESRSRSDWCHADWKLEDFPARQEPASSSSSASTSSCSIRMPWSELHIREREGEP